MLKRFLLQPLSVHYKIIGKLKPRFMILLPGNLSIKAVPSN